MYDNMYYIIRDYIYNNIIVSRLRLYISVHPSFRTNNFNLDYGIFLIRILKYTNKRRLTTVWWYTLVINNEILIL